jgi:hypothetical protein
MAWVKVPPENHPLFHEALPDDRRVETLKMFGGAWIRKAFEHTASLPEKIAKPAKKKTPAAKKSKR